MELNFLLTAYSKWLKFLLRNGLGGGGGGCDGEGCIGDSCGSDASGGVGGGGGGDGDGGCVRDGGSGGAVL